MDKKLLLNNLKKRYFRSVIAYPEGHLGHHADCNIHRSLEVYGFAFCSCGLHHDFIALDETLVDKIYGKDVYHNELARENPSMSAVNCDRTNEEFRELMKENNWNFVTMEVDPEDMEYEWSIIREVFGDAFHKRRIQEI